MRKKLILLCVLCCLVLGLAVNAYAAADATVTVTATPSSASSGDELTVSATLTNCSVNLHGMKFAVTYNTNAFEFVEGSGSANAKLIGANVNSGTAGRVVLQYTTTEEAGVSVTGETLVTFKLKVKDVTTESTQTFAIDKSDSDFLTNLTFSQVGSAKIPSANVLTGETVSCTVSLVPHTHEPTTPNTPKTAGSDATCTEEGSLPVYACSCGKDIVKINNVWTEKTDDNVKIVPLGHQWGTDVPATVATCTEKGNPAYTPCTRCNKNFDTSTKTAATPTEVTAIEIPAKGHHMTKVPGEAATCVADGTKDSWECDQCNKTFLDEKGTKEVNAEEDLKITKESVQGNADAHKLVPESAGKEATTTETGLKATYKCEACGQIYIKNDDGTVTLVTPDTDLTIPKKTATTSDKEDKGTEKKSPKTGDETNIALWVTLFVFCAATATVVILTKKARKNN